MLTHSRRIPLLSLLALTLATPSAARASETQTFQMGDPPEPIVVRAADVELGADGGLARGVLIRAQEVSGVPLPAGAIVYGAPGGEVRYLESPAPVEVWGMRLAAGEPIYPGSLPGGTLAVDAAVGGLPLAGGTEVALEFGHASPRWKAAVVRGTLAGRHLVGGVPLPAGTELVRDCQRRQGGDHSMIHATLPKSARLHGIAVSAAVAVEIYVDGRFTATLAAPTRGGPGIEVPAGERATFYPDGTLLRARASSALQIRGMVLVAGEEVELWPSGRLKRAVLAPGSFGQPARGVVVAGFADVDSDPTYAFVRAPLTRGACGGPAGRIVAWLPSGAPLVRVRCGDTARLHRELAATVGTGGVAGTHWPEGTAVAWEDHPEAGPVIALTSPRQHTVHGVRAAADAPVRLDRQGRLVACTSAAEQVVDGVSLAAGQRASFRYDDRSGARMVVLDP